MITGFRAGEIDVWRIRLGTACVPPPTADEAERASRFIKPILSERYLRAHGALRAILAKYTAASIEFAVTTSGKPYLPGTPECRFNLSHSHDMALVAVAQEVEVGVDVEWVRSMGDQAQIAERFFPPSEAAAHMEVPLHCRERDFFRRWTRIEAVLKARGVGLYGLGEEADGEWTVQAIEIDSEYEAAVAAPRVGMTVRIFDF
ncbi:MAG TPA: 4'-phosphopantetheinyl transferase superfamily protein [Bryobacteraceae bacterium]|nr:4'-phosphopantetheinyl transferase superfamily protein [Bryobacteraceae bacterium]